MAGATVTIEGKSDVGAVVSADLAKASDGLKKIESSATGSVSPLNAVNGALAAVSAIAAAGGILASATALYELGAAASEAGSALDAMTGGGADQYIKAIALESDGMISKFDAAKISNRALNYGLELSADQMGQLAKAAATLGDVTGKSTTEAMDLLTDAIGRGNTRMLAQLGIVSKGKDMTAEVNALMATNSGLTFTQASQLAALNAVLARSNELQLQGVGAQRSAADSAERLEASWKNLTTAVGQNLAGAVQPAVDGANNLVGGINNVNDAIAEERQRLMDTTTTWDDYVAKASVIPYLNTEVARSAGAQTESYMKLKAAWEQNREAVLAHAGALANNTRDAEAAQDALNGLSKMAADQVPTLEELVKTISDYNTVLQEQSARQLVAQSQVATLNGLWWGAGTATKAAASDIADLNDALAKETDKLADLNQWGGSDKSFAKTSEAIADLTGKLADANQQVAFGPGANWPKIFEFAGQQMQQMNLPASELLARMNDLGMATGQVTEMQIAQGSALRGLNNLYATGAIDANTYISGLSQIPAALDAVTAAAIPVKAAVQEATSAAAAAGASAASIIQTAIDTAKSARDAAAPEAAKGIVEGVQSALDQINAMPGAQLKLLPDEALTAIQNVSNAVSNLAVTTAATPAAINADPAGAERGVARAQELMNSIKDKTVYLTVDLIDNTGGGGPAAPEGRAVGGPVFQGQGYIVGERGPEFFMPNVNGTIVPNNQISTISGASGGSTGPSGGGGIFVTLNAYGVNDPIELVQMIDRELTAQGRAFARAT